MWNPKPSRVCTDGNKIPITTVAPGFHVESPQRKQISCEKRKPAFFQQSSTKLKMDTGEKDQSKPPKPTPLKHLALCRDFQISSWRSQTHNPIPLPPQLILKELVMLQFYVYTYNLNAYAKTWCTSLLQFEIHVYLKWSILPNAFHPWKSYFQHLLPKFPSPLPFHLEGWTTL